MCPNHTTHHGNNFIDLTGQQFGRLTVVSFAGIVNRRARWECVCTCGARIVTGRQDLRSGRTRSCGCLRRENTTAIKTTHGMRHTPEYKAWAAAKGRCTNPTDRAYEYYGGRGITFSPSWLDSFENFLADMGMRPSPRHTLDRIDNSKGYAPDNCRWASRMEQANNRRSNHLVTYQGETRTLRAWSDITGIPYKTLHTRIIARKWSAERTFTTPIKSAKNPT